MDKETIVNIKNIKKLKKIIFNKIVIYLLRIMCYYSFKLNEQTEVDYGYRCCFNEKP